MHNIPKIRKALESLIPLVEEEAQEEKGSARTIIYYALGHIIDADRILRDFQSVSEHHHQSPAARARVEVPD